MDTISEVGVFQNPHTGHSGIPKVFLQIPEVSELFTEWQARRVVPETVAALLQKLERLSLNKPTLLAALLFLLYPEAESFPQELGKSFPEAAPLYRRLLKVHQFPARPKNPEQAELTLRMLLTVLGDVQLLAIFLVLQLQRLEQLVEKVLPEPMSAEEQDATAWTALHVHAPLAGRLGIFWIKSELEDGAFRHLEPENYQDLKQKVARKRSERSQIVADISTQIQMILQQAGISSEVQGRYKRFYSIYQKLEKVDHDFERIQDLIAFRVLVDKLDQCYVALGYIHESWTPKENRFKDYIANPKSNGYQSLHTTVTDANGEPIEIQIRTREMHRMAEYGVAAHWLYKEKLHQPNDKKVAQIAESLAKKNEETMPQIDLYSDKIYVMTPAREIRELPQAATPVDFAYAIHTEVGNRTTGAKANGSILRLDALLRSGDTVEILTSSRQEPRKEWLDFVKTRHARNKIKHALHERNRETHRKEGLEMLEREFRNNGLNLNRMIREGRMEQKSRQRKNQEFEHILLCIGEGSVRSEELRRWFAEDAEYPVRAESGVSASVPETSSTTKTELKPQNRKATAESSANTVLVDGMDDILTRTARCCAPEKNEPIQGYLTQERVISIHREDCPSLQGLNPERMIQVRWRKEEVANSDGKH